jgi:Fe-S-cluster-containing hydrogenase component 2
VVVTNPDACPQNHACPAMRYCPAGAITQESIYSAPRIDHGLCTECGACSRVCGRVFSHVVEEVGVRG